MGRASISCLGLIIAISWLLGGGIDLGPYLVGGWGVLCLVLAIVEGGRRLRDLFSWRITPWLLWLVLVGISVANPSHEPKHEELVRDHAMRLGFNEAPDSIGTANPSMPLDHVEWLPRTPDRSRTAFYLIATAGVMALAVAIIILPMGRKTIRKWLTILFVNSLLLTLAGLWFYFQDKTLIFNWISAEGGTPYASFHYKNVWVAYALLSACIGIGLAARGLKSGQSLTSAKSPTAFFAFGIPLMLLSFPLIQSRAGILMGSIVVGWLALHVLVNLIRQPAEDRSWLKLAGLGVLSVSLGWFAWQTTGPQIELMLQKSENQVEQVSAHDPTGRMVLIRDTIEMAKVKPWFGWGLATFSQVYPRFQGAELYHRVVFPDGDFVWLPTYYEFTHCDWVQYLAETGIVGLLLLIATPIAWYVHCWRRGRSNPVTHWLGVGCVLVLLLATFEFPFGSEAVALLFATCFALAGKYALLEKKARRRRKRSSSEKSRSASSKRQSDQGRESSSVEPVEPAT